MAVSVASVFAATSLQTASASDHSQTESTIFNLRVDELVDSLKDYSEKTGISLIYDNRLVREKLSAPVSGSYPPDQALELLLAGSGLGYREISKNTWAIFEENDKATKVDNTLSVGGDTGERRALKDIIVVTATYRAPINTAGARTLYTLDGEQLRLNGSLNVAEPIYELPSSVASVSSANTALLASTNGLNLADLRGLGPERTLVLVNGRRYTRTSGGNGTILGVDLNSIPAPFVERIEIVNQGAGASLGVEAVAGVVNIVLRDEIDGIVLTVDGGVSEHGDAAEFSFSALAGKHFGDDRGRFMAGVTFASEPSLLVQQRPRISSPYGFGLDGRRSFDEGAIFAPGFGGSSITPNGMLSGIVTTSGDIQLFNFSTAPIVLSPDGQSFEPFEARLDQLYNWTTDFSALPEIERIIGYASGEFEIAPEHSAYAEFHFAQSDIQSQIASSPVSSGRGRSLSFGDAIFVPADNPFTPSGLLAEAELSAGQTVSGFLLNRRFVELGPRIRNITRKTFQVTGGFEGAINEKWRYDVSYQYGRNRVRDVATGLADNGQLQIALDANRCMVATGCTPINIFGSATITQSQADFIRANPLERFIETREQIAQLKISGPLYKNKGKNALVAIGVEHRRESLNDQQVFSPTVDQTLGESIIPGATGNTVLTELFFNASFPLIVDAPWTQSLEIGGAYRFTKRHGVSSFSNISSNLNWSPFDGIEFYAHVFHGGRAPNIMELFAAGPNNNNRFFDPCSTQFGSPTGVVAENCSIVGPLGVPNAFTQENALTLYESTGNSFLEEERINSRVFGITSDIHSFWPLLPGDLTISANWWRHGVTNAVSSVNSATAIQQCYNSKNLSDFLCGTNPASGNLFIQRDPVTRQITTVESIFLNGGALRTTGLDARLQYFAEFGGFALADTFSLDALYTYTHRSRSQRVFTESENVQEGLVAFPRHQLHITASLGTETLKTVWTVRRRGKAVSTRAIDIPEAHIPAVVYVDAAVQLRPTQNTILFAGVENLFHTNIPIVAFAPNGYFFEHYDVIGRRFFAGIKAEF